jgi:hypothetical protein
MKIYAFFMLSGCFLTLFIPETKRLTLEQLAAEAEDRASGDHASGKVESETQAAVNGSDGKSTATI